jgi:hypothetical protein
LLVQGPPGVGKTHLVVVLGVRAIEQGFGVAFYRLEDLLHEMRKDAAVSPSALRRKKYFNVSYLTRLSPQPKRSKHKRRSAVRMVLLRHPSGAERHARDQLVPRQVRFFHHRRSWLP